MLFQVSLLGYFSLTTLSACVIAVLSTLPIWLGTLICLVGFAIVMHCVAAHAGNRLNSENLVISRDRSDEIKKINVAAQTTHQRFSNSFGKRSIMAISMFGFLTGATVMPVLLIAVGARIENPLSISAVIASGGVLIAAGSFVLAHCVLLLHQALTTFE